MISMLVCAWGGTPVLGAISSSFQTRNEPQPVRVASPCSPNEKWCLAFSQLRSSPPSSLNGLRSIIDALPGKWPVVFRQHTYGHSDELEIETVETYRF